MLTVLTILPRERTDKPQAGRKYLQIMCHRKLDCKIYKELLQYNNKTNNSFLKIGKNIRTDISVKKIYR